MAKIEKPQAVKSAGRDHGSHRRADGWRAATSGVEMPLEKVTRGCKKQMTRARNAAPASRSWFATQMLRYP